MAEEIVMSNENKIRVGKLIRVYQKEKGITLFDLVENVCSRQVATNFNKGIPAKNDDSYLNTLAKLGFSYNYRHDMDEYILLQSKRLRDAVEWYDTKLMAEICKETIERLEPYRKYIIEYEYIRAFEAIYKFHFVNIKIEDETNHFLETMNYLNQDMVDVLTNIIFKYCYKYYDFNNQSKGFNKTKSTLSKLNLKNTNYSVNHLNYAILLLTQKYHFDSIKIFEKVENEYKKKHNYNGLLIVYSRMFWLIGNIQEKSLNRFESYFNQIVKVKSNEINKDLILLGQINLAINYFENGDYLKAKEYFLKTVCCDKFYVKSVICLKFIGSYLPDISVDIIMKPLEECEIITPREKIFYEYYYMKSNNVDLSKLIDYIDSFVLLNIESHDSFYYVVFKNELETISKQIAKSPEYIRRKLSKIIDKFRKL